MYFFHFGESHAHRRQNLQHSITPVKKKYSKIYVLQITKLLCNTFWKRPK